MTEEQEHYCEVETIKCPHYTTLVVLSLETGDSPADILAAVNRRRPQFGGFLVCTGRGEVSLYTDRHVRQAAAMLQAGRGWSAVWEALNLQHTSKGKKEMRSKSERWEPASRRCFAALRTSTSTPGMRMKRRSSPSMARI